MEPILCQGARSPTVRPRAKTSPASQQTSSPALQPPTFSDPQQLQIQYQDQEQVSFAKKVFDSQTKNFTAGSCSAPPGRPPGAPPPPGGPPLPPPRGSRRGLVRPGSVKELGSSPLRLLLMLLLFYYHC